METENIIFHQQSLMIPEKALITKNSFANYGNEIEDIISNKPPFIVRWGTVFFLVLLLILATICWFIKYPDIVEAPAKLTSINAPKQIICLINGKLIKLFVKENKQVKQGDVLGLIESTANHNEILRLNNNILQSQQLLQNNSSEKISAIFNTNYSQLGELQQSYQTLSQSYLTFKNYLSNGFYLHKKEILKNRKQLC